MYETDQDYLERLRALCEADPEPMHNCAGRGIVIAGGGRFLLATFILLDQLRRTGCQLPVEIWHRASERMPIPIQKHLQTLGAECIDGDAMRRRAPVKTLEQFAIKPFAILHSKFDEVLFLDADNLVLRDPTYLFDLPEYQDLGALFWPDRADLHDRFKIPDGAWNLLGVTKEDRPEFETGQLLIHKTRCLRELSIVMHMNEHQEFYYDRVSYGDKDTFYFAFRLTRRSYHRITYRPTRPCIGLWFKTHYDPAGKPLFQHGRKWHDIDTLNIPGYRLGRECLASAAVFRKLMKQAAETT